MPQGVVPPIPEESELELDGKNEQNDVTSRREGENDDVAAEPLSILRDAAELAADGGERAMRRGASLLTSPRYKPAAVRADSQAGTSLLTSPQLKPAAARSDGLPFPLESQQSSKSNTDEDISPHTVFQNYRRHGSRAMQRYPTSAFKEVCCFGLTGETYYDFDRGLDPDHPICIIHFNDVYNIEPQADGTGGISRFVTALRSYADSDPLVFFSGDAFNPSFISTYTKGRHMVPFLNMLKIHTACVGNHDLDFGVDHLEYLCGSTRFPWLLSNIFDADAPDRPLAGAALYRLFEWQGHKIGVIGTCEFTAHAASTLAGRVGSFFGIASATVISAGLVEHDWIATLSQVNLEDVVYVDYVEAANQLCPLLRQKECALIIALTHMRAPNDERLAREALDIDIILGGHDHEYFGVKRIKNTIVCKSGTDFREFTCLTIYPNVSQSASLRTSTAPVEGGTHTAPPNAGCDKLSATRLPRFLDRLRDSHEETAEPDHYADVHLVPGDRGGGAFILPRFCGGSVLEWECVDVNPSTFSSNRHVDKLVSKYISELSRHLDKPLGVTAVPLETRFPIIRTRETNLGNWLADLMRRNTKADVACLNSGTVRSDSLIPPGELLLKHLVQMLPMPDQLIVVRVKGAVLRQMAEVSVSQYPKTEGRFLQVSGLRFKWDSTRPPNERVIDIQLQTGVDQFETLDPTREVTVCTKEYLAEGKDGYDCLLGAECIITAEDSPNLPTMVQNSFAFAAIASGLRKARNPSTLRKVDTFRAMSEVEQREVYGMINVDGEYQLSCKVEGRIIDIAQQKASW